MHSLTTLVLLLGLSAAVLSGSVHRDPVTGKWVASDGNTRESDSRSGHDDGGLFGFDFIDNRNASPQQLVQTTAQIKQPTLSSAPIPHVARAKRGETAPMPASLLRTRDHTSKHSKYTAEIPVSQALQTDKPAVVSKSVSQQQVLAQQDQEEQPQAVGPTVVQRVLHEVEAQEQVQTGVLQGDTLTTRTIGTLCRFRGVAPLTGCPAEAANGCVDRTPCDRSCDNGAYFSWRCQGTTILTGDDAAAALERAQDKEEEPLAPTSDEHIAALAARIEVAMQNQDYASLARAIVDTQQASQAHHVNAAAAASLLQTAFEAQNKAQRRKI